ncbi:MAG: NAD(P)H-binding protein [bacterium]|nr:NAD(P)H-binding protein [bacterium]
MKIVVYGANGKVGRLVVQELLNAGHSVVAFVHGQSQFDENVQLKITRGDIYNAAGVYEAMNGCDAVISTLGSWGTANKDILTVGMTNIIPAMKSQNIRRIISLTGHDARWSKDKINLTNRLTHPFLKLAIPKILKDGELHLQLLDQSGLDWTVLRSPVMNERGDYKLYKLNTNRPLPWRTINRQSVAKAMLEIAETDSFITHAPFIHRS